MTQTPTDALRLVPRRATPQQLETAAFNLSAEIGAAEAMKLGPHIERAYELLVAAAPASPLPGGGDEALIAELKEARGLLKPFSVYYEINDLDDRLADDTIEVPVGDLRLVRAFLARNGKGER